MNVHICESCFQSHTPCCPPCPCRQADDWDPESPCGGISVNGAEPPWCEVHMKRWGHRRYTKADA